MPGLTDEVRETCAAVARAARHVRIDEAALERMAVAADVPPPELDPVRHYLEGPPEDVAQYLLTLDAINFGSGWFPTLRKRTDPGSARTVSGYFTVAWNLADHVRAHGPWDAAQLRALRTEDVADVLGQPRDHELMALFAQALRELGRWLGGRTAADVVAAAGGSAERFAATLAHSMAMWADIGFYKRAQIAAYDLVIGGVADFGDLERLTIFADNLVPHVLRCEGALVYSDELAALVDGETLLPTGSAEREIRACAVVACEALAARAGVAAPVVDMWLWNRGQDPAIKARPRHRTRCVFY